MAAAYRRSFFPAIAHGTRAGNVIGGGDWAEDRLVPDCIRALSAGETIALRNPRAVRPWQHVLEPLCGYLLLAERLHADAAAFGEAWNFGPADDRYASRRLGRVAYRRSSGAATTEWRQASGDPPHESDAIMVDASRARLKLGWTQRLPLETALHWTVDWYRRQEAGEAALALTDEQLARYCEMAAA